MESIKFTLEADVDDYVKETLKSLGLKKIEDFNEKSSMSEYLKMALKGSAKTENKTNYGQPDFSIEKYSLPVIIEDKLKNDKHIALSKDVIKMDGKSIRDYAVNGAIYYAQNMIASKKYTEVIAIGISGESKEDINISVYYVFSPSLPPKLMKDYKNLNFLQNKDSFGAFYKDVTISEVEKHKYLVESRERILRQAKTLNKLMDNFNIGVDQRVVYVSGMLLAMQDIKDNSGNIIDYGVTPTELNGIQTDQKRDSIIILNHIKDFLNTKKIEDNKKKIMITSFESAIALDISRDEKIDVDKLIGDKIKEKSSITKQVFTYLYEYVFLSIDLSHGALDIMAEMYSTFLKYALSDGASLGKVLTPPYVTNLMAKLLGINKDSKVMDIATGSAAFLVASMDLMIADANKQLGKNTSVAQEKIDKLKKTQLLGIEIDAKMYTLAASNMILRGDGSTKILKADSFKTPASIFSGFNADRLLLNPPFSATENGLPFFEFGLDNMEKGGLGAVIIMDSAGAGKAKTTAIRILKKHKMLASIKMPSDLFIPNAIVQTSIYIFQAKHPHNFELDKVKFIDFRNDGYKRTKRAIKDIDSPAERYNDLCLIYNLGLTAASNIKFHKELWDLNAVYCEDVISPNGNDWNFEKHFKYNVSVNNSNHIEAESEYVSWKFKEIISKSNIDDTGLAFPKMKEFPVKSLFIMEGATPSYDKGDLTKVTDNNFYDYITRQSTNRGICERTGFIKAKGLHEKGTFSLGLMQMLFFYRENGWYAGQFVKKISMLPKYSELLDDYSGLYIETVLNGLSKKLLSVIVRDVEKEFYGSTISLPVNEHDELDFDYMSNYIKENRAKLFKIISKYIKDEQKKK